jgi:hypothetical protein
MKELLLLVKSLNKREIALIRGVYSSRLNSEEKWRLKLFEYLIQSKKVDENGLKADLGYKGSKSAFSHLKTRFRNDVLNVIMLQESNKKFRSPMNSASFEVKKKMAFSELLYRRGLTDLGDQVIKEGVEISKKYEFFVENYVLIETQRISQGVTKGQKVIDKFNLEVVEVVKVVEANSKAIGLFNDFTARYINKKGLDENKLNTGRIILEDLKKIYTKFPYARIGFWYFRAALSFYNQLQDFDNAYIYGESLVRITENSPALYSQVNFAGANKDLAEVCLSGKRFELALKYSIAALGQFNPKLNNYLLTLENYFQASFYLGNYELSNLIIFEAIEHPRFFVKKETKAKWDYYKSCLLFKLKDFSSSLKLLNFNSNIYLLDKGELQLGYRLMLILLYIETGKYELLDFELDSFRKSLFNLKGYNIERVKIILKILKRLEKENFEFNNFDLYINLINEFDCDKFTRWQTLGFEIVNFPEWFYSKF